jgi:uncharacterized protein (TIGR03437 family)
MSRGPGILLLSVALVPAAAQQYAGSVFAGGSPPPLTAPALNASVGAPGGIAVDSGGNVYFTSTNCVFKLDKSGTVTRIAGTSDPGYDGDGRPATDEQLSLSSGAGMFPSGVAVDSGGNVYIVDAGNFRIREITPQGAITTFAGNGKTGYSGDGGSALNAEFEAPLGVAVDSSGNLYIADQGSSDGGFIRMVTPAGIITTVAGSGTYGTAGLGAPATRASLEGPQSVAVDSVGNIYFGEQSGRVLKVSTNKTISLVTNVSSPLGIAADSSGNLYLAVQQNNALFKVTAGGVKTQIAGTTAGGFSGDNGPAIYAQLSDPMGVAVDASGDLYLADTGNNRIRKIAPAGTISTIAGDGTESGDNRLAVAAQLLSPYAVALDSLGNVYITDSGECRVRKVAPSGTIMEVAGNGICAGGTFTEGGQAVSAQLFNTNGMAVDSAGNLYISDAYTVRRVSPLGIITTYAGTDLMRGYSGDGGKATGASLGGPQGLATDSAGNLYIADTFNYVVRKVTPAGIISTVAGNGKSGDSGDGGQATSAEFRDPSAVTLDSVGNLYIADGFASRVRKVAPNGIITTVAGTGTSGYSSASGGAATATQLDGPSGVAVDGGGNLFITDTFNSRVLKVQASTGSTFEVAGTDMLGSLGYSGSDTTWVIWPDLLYGIATDASDNLYVADNTYNIVRLLKPLPLSITTTSPLPSGTVGVAYSVNLAAAGGTAPYHWSVASGTLPAGLSLSATGTILGTPTAVGAASFTAEVIDSASSFLTRSYSLATIAPAIVIAAVSPPKGQIGSPYSLTFAASGGTPPYTWSLAQGALPPGLTLNSAGAISGTPTTSGTYGFTVKASDSAVSSATRAASITITYPSGYTGPPAISSNGVVSAGGFQNAIRSGSWATIFGTNLSATSRDWNAQDFNGKSFPLSLDGVSVTVGGTSAFIRSISPTQINFQVPDGLTPGNAFVYVTNAAGSSAAATAVIADYAPAFFVAVTANSRSYVAATEAASGGTVYIGPAGTAGVRPAMVGDNLTLWGTGFGPTQPNVPAGALFNGAAPVVDPVQIYIDNIPVTPQFAGMSGAGLYQFNFVVPNISPGDHQLTANVQGAIASGIWLTTQ